MRHSQSSGSSRTSTKRDIPAIRRPHRLVHHRHRRQYSRTIPRTIPRTVPMRREIYAKRLRRSPSRPRFYRENPKKVDKRRGRSNFLEKEKKKSSQQDNPEEKLSTREKDKILDQLASDIEERIQAYKKDQLSKILSRNIGPERDARGTHPAQPESNE